MIRDTGIALCIFVLVGCGQPAFPAQGAGFVSEVQESYAKFTDALLKGDGAAAASLVTPNTLAAYERCRKLALDAGDADFELVPQYEVILIFQLRWLLSEEDLRSMNGAEVFAWGVEEGLIRKEVIGSLELDKIHREGASAIATLRKLGQPVTDAVFEFKLNECVWQLDLQKIMAATESAFAEILEETGKTKTEFAIYLIEKTYEEEVPPQILNGPLK